VSLQTTRITKAGKWLVLAAFLFWVAGYNLWWMFDNYAIYDACMAVTVFLLITSIHLSAEGLYRYFSLAFACLAASNVVDELFFDPTLIDLNEYIAATFILISVIWLYLKNARTQDMD
jgi:hypothetical protein